MKDVFNIRYSEHVSPSFFRKSLEWSYGSCYQALPCVLYAAQIIDNIRFPAVALELYDPFSLHA